MEEDVVVVVVDAVFASATPLPQPSVIDNPQTALNTAAYNPAIEARIRKLTTEASAERPSASVCEDPHSGDKFRGSRHLRIRYAAIMPSARGFDAELAQLESLRDADPSTTEAPLRKALANRNNFIVAKAAKLIAAHNHRTLIPDLRAAFDRFAVDPNKSDPQCWAKIDIAKALAGMEYQEPEIFLQGMRTFQPGFTDDAATPLRGLCALALVQCRGLSSQRVLEHLLPLFADKQLPVRVNAARAVEQIGSDASALLLRLRVELASDEPELLGACYSGVLHLEGPSAIPWVARFLHPAEPDDTAAEAAFAIAETRTEAAVTTLLAAYKQTRDPDFRATLLTALAVTRQDKAIDFLLAEIADGNNAAREALENSAPSPAVLERLRAL